MNRKQPTRADAETAILGIAMERGAGRTLCPSEAARALDQDWRPLMPLVREAAASLCADGRIAVTQRGAPVDPLAARGPIRLGLPKA
jgi:hypothetical protein